MAGKDRGAVYGRFCGFPEKTNVNEQDRDSPIDSAVTSAETKKELLTLPKPPYEAGEYVMGKCLVYGIVKLHKKWRGETWWAPWISS